MLNVQMINPQVSEERAGLEVRVCASPTEGWGLTLQGVVGQITVLGTA